MVTRLKSGLRGRTIIVNLPGSKKASDECLRVILPAIPHAMECMKDDERICDCTLDDIEAIKARQKLVEGVTNDIERFQRKVAASRPSNPQNNTPSGGHHSQHGAHHSALQALGTTEITEDDLGLDDIDVESLLSSNNPLAANSTGGDSRPVSTNSNVDDNLKTVPEFPEITVNQAFDLVLEKTKVLGLEEVTGTDAYGRTLAEDVKAPNTASSGLIAAKDGYAVTGSILQGEVRAIKSGSGTADCSEVSRVGEGAALPPGTNTVIPLDSMQLVDGNKIQVLRSTALGQGTRSPDVRNGTKVILKKGVKLGASDIGKLALIGVSAVKTYKNPVVAVVSVGQKETESSNHITLQLSLRQHSVTPLDLGIIPVDSDALSKALTDAVKRADVIICAGESPKGRSLAQSLIDKKFGGTTHFGKVAMNPWQSSYFATSAIRNEQKVFFVLPECLTASILSTIFVIPVLRKMSGVEDPGHTILKAKVPSNVQLKDVPVYQQCQVSWIPGESLPLIEKIDGRIEAGSPGISDAKALLLLPARSSQCSMIKRDDATDVLLITQI